MSSLRAFKTALLGSFELYLVEVNQVAVDRYLLAK